MRYFIICLSALCATCAIGCGQSYETRLNRTVERLKYIQKLDKNLSAPVGEPFKKENIYLRPPKGLELSSTFSLGETKGLFDVASSFNDLQKGQNGLRLHVVARVDKPKKAAGKNAPPPADAAARGPFLEDLKNLLITGYGSSESLETPAYKSEKIKTNSYKRLMFATANSRVEVYVLQAKPYDVALIWEIPNSLAKTEPALALGKPLSLEAFATGTKAVRFLQAGVDDESGGGRPGTGDSAGQAF
jgi:hypothetical protein